LKHFPLDEDNSFTQWSSQMTQKDYENLVGQEGKKQDPGKGKMLIQCLDRSGSMSGTPMKALKEGALLLGESILKAEVKPF